jgi:hypothetical protein
VAAIERALRWHSSAPEAVAETLEGLREHHGLAIPRVPTEALVRLVGLAVVRAREGATRAEARGCFVNP